MSAIAVPLDDADAAVFTLSPRHHASTRPPEQRFAVMPLSCPPRIIAAADLISTLSPAAIRPRFRIMTPFIAFDIVDMSPYAFAT